MISLLEDDLHEPGESGGYLSWKGAVKLSGDNGGAGDLVDGEVGGPSLGIASLKRRSSGSIVANLQHSVSPCTKRRLVGTRHEYAHPLLKCGKCPAVIGHVMDYSRDELPEVGVSIIDVRAAGGRTTWIYAVEPATSVSGVDDGDEGAADLHCRSKGCGINQIHVREQQRPRFSLRIPVGNRSSVMSSPRNARAMLGARKSLRVRLPSCIWLKIIKLRTRGQPIGRLSAWEDSRSRITQLVARGDLN